jgi:hypothetical protein
MRIPKVLSILTLVLLACQTICGFYLTNNPAAFAEVITGFHTDLGITTLVVATAAALSVFRAAKKSV